MTPMLAQMIHAIKSLDAHTHSSMDAKLAAIIPNVIIQTCAMEMKVVIQEFANPEHL